MYCFETFNFLIEKFVNFRRLRKTIDTVFKTSPHVSRETILRKKKLRTFLTKNFFSETEREVFLLCWWKNSGMDVKTAFYMSRRTFRGKGFFWKEYLKLTSENGKKFSVSWWKFYGIDVKTELFVCRKTILAAFFVRNFPSFIIFFGPSAEKISLFWRKTSDMLLKKAFYVSEKTFLGKIEVKKIWISSKYFSE